ncbi:MAG: adenine deaminase [Phycisphaerae bacterium]|nr:adenine deaminase [Phycisphaerae bacterium]
MTVLVDTLLTNCRLVDVVHRKVVEQSIGIQDGLFVLNATEGRNEFDLQGAYVSPGFIDAHMHVESTMLPPASFATLSVPHGTTTVILDPHEIANVMGVQGIELLYEDAQGLPIDCFFMASSCVPASPLETSGANLSADDLEPLFAQGKVIGLAEMMNFPAVLNDDPEVLKKIKLGLKYGRVDGHCPGLRGEELQKYIDAGITSDHESTTADEAKEKLDRGLQLYIREGSAAKNLEALLPAVTNENINKVCFCTDDRHPADLKNEGHIDHIIRKSISLGLDPIDALAISTIHCAAHYGLSHLGSIEDGKQANFVVFDDLKDIQTRQVWHAGHCVAKDGTLKTPLNSSTDWTPSFNSVKLPESLSEKSFCIQTQANKIRVIGIHDGQLVTDELHLDALKDGENVIANPEEDVLKLAVIERHQSTGNIGIGFAKGFGIRGGAIASTVGHDAHNVTVLGDNDSDMFIAAKALGAAGGGQCVVSNGEVTAMLPLPIAGLMSDAKPEDVIQQQQNVLTAVHKLGCNIEDSFMPLSFLPLSVIPSLKLSDLGIVDVNQFKIVPLGVDDE